jgi:hypothetical protein
MRGDRNKFSQLLYSINQSRKHKKLFVRCHSFSYSNRFLAALRSQGFLYFRHSPQDPRVLEVYPRCYGQSRQTVCPRFICLSSTTNNKRYCRSVHKHVGVYSSSVLGFHIGRVRGE